MVKKREGDGKFAIGNSGGPGRPRRDTERDYLRALTKAVPPDEWQAIVNTAVQQAKEGDGKARDWLTRYLIGDSPPSLSERVAADAYDPSGEKELFRLIVTMLGAMAHETDEFAFADSLSSRCTAAMRILEGRKAGDGPPDDE